MSVFVRVTKIHLMTDSLKPPSTDLPESSAPEPASPAAQSNPQPAPNLVETETETPSPLPPEKPDFSKMDRRDIEAWTRREKLKTLMLCGWSVSDLTKALRNEGFETSNRTTNRDLLSIRQELAKSWKPQKAEVLVASFVLDYDRVMKELWRVYISAPSYRDKISALEKLLIALPEKTKLLERIGIVPPLKSPAGGLQVHTQNIQQSFTVETVKELEKAQEKLTEWRKRKGLLPPLLPAITSTDGA